MPAANSGTLLVMAFGGRDPATGRTFVASELAAGGMGARPDKDGIDVIETDVSNCMNIPVESVEMNFPLRIPRLRLWNDSGGAGRFRGGLGLEKVFEATTTDVMVSHRGERFASSPWGLEGGAPGARAHAVILSKDGTREDLPSKKMIVLHPGGTPPAAGACGRPSGGTRRTGCSSRRRHETASAPRTRGCRRRRRAAPRDPRGCRSPAPRSAR